jgi:hypothetical protein
MINKRHVSPSYWLTVKDFPTSLRFHVTKLWFLYRRKTGHTAKNLPVKLYFQKKVCTRPCKPVSNSYDPQDFALQVTMYTLATFGRHRLLFPVSLSLRRHEFVADRHRSSSLSLPPGALLFAGLTAPRVTHRDSSDEIHIQI